jgi:hypothetical protein
MTAQEQRLQRQVEKQKRIEADLANAARDAPIRAVFHAWLESEGFAPQATPAPGSSYMGSHLQTLWECWLAATLNERGLTRAAVA